MILHQPYADEVINQALQRAQQTRSNPEAANVHSPDYNSLESHSITNL
jgi:hypothetical protein